MNIENNENEIADELLKAATKELEEILEIDESYSLAYYKLGFFYKYNEQYLKAQLSWKKFLILDKEHSLTEAINRIISKWELYSKNAKESFNDLYSLDLQIYNHREQLKKKLK